MQADELEQMKQNASRTFGISMKVSHRLVVKEFTRQFGIPNGHCIA